MENNDLTPHASVLSRSALHAYITGPASPAAATKSTFNPYRKRSGLLSLVSLDAAEEALQKSIDSEVVIPEETHSLPEGLSALTGTPAPT